MNLADFTAPDLMISPLAGCTAKAVLDELWSVLTRSPKLTGFVTVSGGVPSRLLYGAVEMSGWALLHVRVPELKAPVFAYGQRPLPIVWPGCRGAVHTVFLVAAPENDAGHYLAILSAIARLARAGGQLDALRQAQTAAEIYQQLQGFVVPAVQPQSEILSPQAASV